LTFDTAGLAKWEARPISRGDSTAARKENGPAAENSDEAL
jgi:hypothetical protein